MNRLAKNAMRNAHLALIRCKTIAHIAIKVNFQIKMTTLAEMMQIALQRHSQMIKIDFVINAINHAKNVLDLMMKIAVNV